MTLEYILIGCVLLLLALLAFAAYKLFKFSIIIIEFEDNIETCLDLLDARYKSMTEILEIPVFFDSVEVRRVINDITACRESLVIVANKLTKNTRSEIESKEKIVFLFYMKHLRNLMRVKEVKHFHILTSVQKIIYWQKLKRRKRIK